MTTTTASGETRRKDENNKPVTHNGVVPAREIRSGMARRSRGPAAGPVSQAPTIVAPDETELPLLAADIWEQRVNQDIGRRIHWLIQEAVTAGAGPADMDAATRAMLKAHPVLGAVAASVRVRCSSAATVYLRRCRPKGFVLVGREVPMGSAAADLVWRRESDGAVLVDELKSGYAESSSPSVWDQVSRLVLGAAERHGDDLLGVRVVPLAAPSGIWMARLVGSKVVTVVVPEGVRADA